MPDKRRIGLLGGSFNPAHAGHAHISREALKRLRLDEIWWLVSPQNPLKSKSELEDYATRFGKAQSLAPRGVKVLDIEAREGLYYTVDTLAYLKQRFPHAKFIWLMGADNLAGFHRWRDWRRIAALVPIAILDRAPFGLHALHQPFARIFSRARLLERHAHLLADASPAAWMYLTIPRHPLSATYLRKTLGKAAFLRNNKGN